MPFRPPRFLARNSKPVRPKRVKRPLLLEALEPRVLFSAVPAVSIDAPGSVEIGETAQVTVRFDNTATGANSGFGPWVDVAFDKTGPDGDLPDVDDGDPLTTDQGVDDGLTLSATPTYLGANLDFTLFTIDSTANSGNGIEHPFAVDENGDPIFVSIDGTGQLTYTNRATAVVTAIAGTNFQNGDQFMVVELPFGSFATDQPTADISFSLDTSELTDLGNDLKIAAVGGFRFGNDELNNPATDPSLISAAATHDITTRLASLSKTFSGPENETATGENYLRTYRINVSIADGQSLTDLHVFDDLADTVQFVSISGSSQPVTVISAPSTDTPGGSVQVKFDGEVNSGAWVEVQFYVPRLDANGNPVLAANSGADRSIDNQAYGYGTWDPIDTRDADVRIGLEATVDSNLANPANPVPDADPEHSGLEAASLTIQKDFSTQTNVGSSGNTPGDVLEFTLDFQISDYFAFENLLVDDLLSDGLRFDSTFVPTLTINGNTYTLGASAFDTANYTVNQNFTGAAAAGALAIDAAPQISANAGIGSTVISVTGLKSRLTTGETFTLNGQNYKVSSTTVPASGGAGTITLTSGLLVAANTGDRIVTGETALQFRVSNELVTRSGSIGAGNAQDIAFAGQGKLLGGGIDPSAPRGDIPNNLSVTDNGATTGQIRYRAVILDKFTDNFPSGEAAVNPRDRLNNTVDITGDVLEIPAADSTVRVATTGDLGGSFAGGKLSGSPLTVDGVTLAAGDRVLVKNQTNAAENGIYEVVTSSFNGLVNGAFQLGQTVINVDTFTAPVTAGDVLTIDGNEYSVASSVNDASGLPTQITLTTGLVTNLTDNAAITGTSVTSIGQVNSAAALANDGGGNTVIPVDGFTSVVANGDTVTINGVNFTVAATNNPGGIPTQITVAGTALVGSTIDDAFIRLQAATLMRVSDFDQSGEMTAGYQVSVRQGTANANANFSLDANVTTVDTDPVNWSVFTAGADPLNAYAGPVTATDDSSESLNIENRDVVKTIYAVNGIIRLSDPTNASSAENPAFTTAFRTGGVTTGAINLQPTDRVTYRLQLVIPSGDVENLRFTDFLPQPVFNVEDPNFDQVSNGVSEWSLVDNLNVGTNLPPGTVAAPGAGQITYGPNHTLHTVSQAVIAKVDGDFLAGVSTINLKAATTPLVNGDVLRIDGTDYTINAVTNNADGLPTQVTFTSALVQNANDDAVTTSSTARASSIKTIANYNEDPAVDNPGIAIDPDSNRIRIEWGDFINDTNDEKSADVLLTVTVSDDPFADGLFLTNQVQSGEGNTQSPGAESTANAIIQIVINEPSVKIQKGVVASTKTGGVSAGGLLFDAVGAATDFTGTLVGKANAEAIGKRNLTEGVLPDGGDTVRYALVAQNTGRGDAFDVLLNDTIQDSFINSYTSLTEFKNDTNFRVFRGDGTELTNFAEVDEFAKVATTANLTSFTGTSNIINGVKLRNGDLVLVKDQTNAAENGIYRVSNSSGATMNLALQAGTFTSVAVLGGDVDTDRRYTGTVGGAWTIDATTNYEYFLAYNTTSKTFRVNLVDKFDEGDANDNKTGGLSRGFDVAADADVSTGTNSVIVLYDLTVDIDAVATSTTTNTVNLTNYASADGARDFLESGDLTEKAQVKFASPEGVKTVVSSEVVDADVIVRAGTTANLGSFTTTDGGQFTGVTNTLDGVALEIGDLVVVKDQTTQAQNGIYQVTSIGAGPSDVTLTRADFFDTAGEVTLGYSVLVSQGTTNATKLFAQQTNGFATLNTDNVVWAEVPLFVIDSAPDVKVASNADIGGTYATTPSNGQFTGVATTIDGIALALNDLVLVKDQTNATQNGIYQVTALAGTATLTRQSAFDENTEIRQNYQVRVEQGTEANKYFAQSNAAFTTLNTDNVTWTDVTADHAQGTRVDTVVAVLTTPISNSVFSATGGPFGENRLLPASATIDGVALKVGDRVLIAGQTDAAQNGIYEVLPISAFNSAARVATEEGGGLNLLIGGAAQHRNTAKKIDGVDLEAGDLVVVSNPDNSEFGGIFQVDGSHQFEVKAATQKDAKTGSADFISSGVSGGNIASGRYFNFDLNVDGVFLNNGDRVLVKDTKSGSQQTGIFEVFSNDNALLGGGAVVLATTSSLSGATYNAGVSNGQFTGVTGTIDGQALTVGRFVIVKDQADQKQNGIYAVTAANTLTRATAFDTDAEYVPGTLIQATLGTQNGGDKFYLSNTSAPTLNTSNITFKEMSGLALRRPNVLDEVTEYQAAAGNAEGWVVKVTGGTQQDTLWGSNGAGITSTYTETAGNWVRWDQFDQSGEITAGYTVKVLEGTNFSGQSFLLASNANPTVDTDPITFINSVGQFVRTADADTTQDLVAGRHIQVLNGIQNVGKVYELQSVVSTLNTDAVNWTEVTSENRATDVVPGELVTYQLRVRVPEGFTDDLVISDTLDTDLAFSDLLSVRTSAGVNLSSNITASYNHGTRALTFTTVDVTNTNVVDNAPEYIYVTYRAIALNTANNQADHELENTASFQSSYTDDKGAAQTLSSTVSGPKVTVVEPYIQTAKQISTDGTTFTPGLYEPLNAGDLLSYRIIVGGGDFQLGTAGLQAQVKVATTGNLAGFNTTGSTDGTGGQITGVATTIDGQTLALGDRVLVWQQTDNTQNGVYQVTDLTGGVTLTRAQEFDVNTEGQAGMVVAIEAGTAFSDAVFRLSADVSTINTNATTFELVQFDEAKVASTGNNLGTAATATQITELGLTFAGNLVIDGQTLAVGDRVVAKDQTTATQNGIYTVDTVTSNVVQLIQKVGAGKKRIVVGGDQTAFLPAGKVITIDGLPGTYTVASSSFNLVDRTTVNLTEGIASSLAVNTDVQIGGADLTLASDYQQAKDAGLLHTGASVRVTNGLQNGGQVFNLENTTAVTIAKSTDAFDLTLSDTLPVVFNTATTPTFNVSVVGAADLRAEDLEITGAGTTGDPYILRTKSGTSFDLPAGAQIVITVSGTVSSAVEPDGIFINEVTVNYSSLNDNDSTTPTVRVTGIADSTERNGDGGVNNYTDLAAVTGSIQTPLIQKSVVATSEDGTTDHLVLADFTNTDLSGLAGSWVGQTTTNATYLTLGGTATETGSGTVALGGVDLRGYGSLGILARGLTGNEANNLRLELIDDSGDAVRVDVGLNLINVEPGGLSFRQLEADLTNVTFVSGGGTFNWANVQTMRLAGDGGTDDMRLELDQIVALQNAVVPGEIVRYRLAVEVPEATFTDMHLLDLLPDHLQYLNDGTARVAFVSNGGGITSTAAGGAAAITGATIAGNQNSLSGLNLTPAGGNGVALGDTNVSSARTSNTDSYSSGTDVFFKLGTIVNNDSDADLEYLVVEFNALVLNTTANQAGAQLDNSFELYINGSGTQKQTGSFTAVGEPSATQVNAFNQLTVSEPQINNLTKSYNGTPPSDAGDNFTYQIDFSNTPSHTTDFAPTVKVREDASIGGSFAGGTFTGVSAPGGTLTIDGQTILVGDRILLDRNSNRNQNGVYIVTEINARDGEATLTRDTDFNEASELGIGARVKVLSGSNAGNTYYSDRDPGTVNSGNIDFSDGAAVSNNISVKYASTGNLTGFGTSDGGRIDGVNGKLGDIDASSLSVGDRVLLKDQTNPQQNGIYRFLNNGGGRLQRVDELDDSDEYLNGLTVSVSDGDVFAGRTFALSGYNGTLNNATSGIQNWNIVDQANAYDVVISEFLDPDVNFQSITIQTPDGNTAALTASGAFTIGSYSGNVTVPAVGATGQVLVTLNELPPEIDITAAKKNITLLIAAQAATTVNAGELLDSETQLNFTSLQGAQGLAIGATGNTTGSGSAQLGASGSATGERGGQSFDGDPTDATRGTQVNNSHPYFSTNLNNYAVSNSLSTLVAGPSIDKSFKNGSLTDDDSSVSTSTGGELVIGETVTFDILVTLPEGTTNNVRVTDVVPDGLFLQSFEVITTAGTGASESSRLTSNFNGTVTGTPTLSTAAPASNGTDVTFTFGNVVVNAESTANTNNAFVLRVVAQVSNVIGNQAGTFLSNEAQLIYSDPDGLNNGGTAGDVTVEDGTTTSGDDTLDPGNSVFDPTVVVREPVLNITKTASTAGADAGDAITYTINISNPAGAGTQAAYDVIIRDIISSDITGATISSVTATGFAGFTAPVAGDFQIAGSNLQLNAGGALGGVLNMNPGSNIQIQIQGSLANTAPIGGLITNKAEVFWSTIPGGLDGDDAGAANTERTGSDDPNPDNNTVDATLLNNQAISSSVATTSIAPVVISQQIIDTSHDGAGATAETSTPQKVGVTIGEFVTYKVTVSLPEGTTRNLVIDMDLPDGLVFDPSTSVVLGTTAGDIPDATFLHDDHKTDGSLAFNGTGVTNGGTVETSRITGDGVYGSGDNVRFRFDGPIVTNGNNNDNDNSFTFTYRALVLDVPANEGILPGQQTLTPTATWVVGDVVAASTTNLAGFSTAGGSLGRFTGVTGTIIDGVTLNADVNNRLILLKDQTTASQNGAYLYDHGTGTLERWDRFDQTNEITNGFKFEVTGGTTNTGTTWQHTGTAIVVNTSAINFASVASNAVLNDTTATGAADSFGITATVEEPDLTINKEISINGSAFGGSATGDAGDVVTYRVTVSHSGNSTASAWDLKLDDVIPTELTGLSITSATITDGAGGNPDRNVASNFTFTGNTLSTVESGASDSVDLAFSTGGASTSEALTLIFTGTLSSSLAPGTDLTNDEIALGYNSLPHDVTAQQTDLISDAATFGGSTGITATDQERQRTATDDVDITVPATLTLTKTLIGTSHTVTGGTTGNDLAIGETATYRLNVTLQEGRTSLVTLTDTTPSGMRYVPGAAGSGVFFRSADGMTATGFNSNTVYSNGDEIAAADLTDSTSDTAAGSLVFRLKQVETTGANGIDTDSFQLDYTLRAVNVAANQRETAPNKVNSAVVSADRNGDGDTGDTGETTGPQTVTAVVKEPTLTLDKALTTSGQDSGDTVVYTFTIQNTGNATAYDINIADTLDTELELVTPGTALAITTNPGYATLTQTGNTAAAVATQVNELRAGDSIVITLTARIKGDANPRDIVTNSATVTYTSLPGTDANERTGTGGVNDYTVTDAAPQFVLAAPTITKSVFTTSDTNTGTTQHTGTNTDLAIGEIVTYDIEVTVREGVTNSFVVRDIAQDDANGVLELLTAQVQSISTGVSASTGLVAGDTNTTKPALLTISSSGGSAANDLLVANFGNVTNSNATNGLGADTIVVRVTARVANDTVDQNADTILNTGRLTYVDGQGTTQNLNSSVNIDVVEPRVTVAKSVTSATTALDAGDEITYSVTIDNLVANGATGPAYEVTLADVLPTGVIVKAGSISAPTLSGSATVETALAGEGTNSISGVFDIPLNGSVTFTYTATLPNTVTPGQTVTSDTNVFFTSQNGTVTGERTGANVTDPEDNTPPTNNAVLNNYAVGVDTSVTVDNPFALTKTLLSSSEAGTTGANLAIGEVATFQLEVAVMEGTTNSISIVDTLPAGLTYVPGSAVVSNANGITVNGFSANIASQTLTLTATSAVNPGGSNATTNNAAVAETDSFFITYRAQVDNSVPNQNVDTLVNDADGSATGVTPDNNNSVTLTVVEPRVNIAKVITSGTSYNAGDEVTYQITLTNTGTSTAFETVLTDAIPTGLLGTGTITTTLNTGTVNATQDSAAVFTGTGNTGLTGTYDIPVGAIVQVTYKAILQNTVEPGQTFTNNADAKFTSLNGTVTGERTGGDIADPTDNTPPDTDNPVDNYAVGAAASLTTNTFIPRVSKALIATSEDHTTGANLAIGEVARYELQVELFEGTNRGLVIQDFLPAGMQILPGNVEILYTADNAVSGAGLLTAGVYDATTSNAISSTLVGNNDTYGSGTDVYFKLGNVVNNDNDADREFAIVRFNAVARNEVANQEGTTLANNFGVLRDTDGNGTSGYVSVDRDNSGTATGTEVATDADNDGSDVGDVAGLSNTVTTTVREPVLTFNQVIPAGSGYDAGDSFDITYTISNTSTFDAFNVRLADLALPAEFDLTAIAFNNGTTGGTVTDSTNLTTDSIDAEISQIAAGTTWTVTATVSLRNSINPGDTYSNPANVTFTSLPGATGTAIGADTVKNADDAGNDTGVTPGAAGSATGERTGADGVGGALNDYALADTETLTVGTPFAVSKVVNTATARIGDIVTYTVTVTVIEGTTTNIQLDDTLPAGMSYVANSSAIVNANGMTITGFNTATLDQTLTSVLNPGTSDATAATANTATDSFTYRYQARVDDVASNDGVTAAGDGDGQTSLVNDLDASADGVTDDNDNTATVTVIEPQVTVTKTNDDADNIVVVGQTLKYTLTITNAAANGATATAYDVRIADVIPSNLENVTIDSITPAGGATGVTDNTTGNTVNISVDEMPVDSTITVVVSTTVKSGVAANTNIDNNVRVHFDSQPGNDNNTSDPGDSTTPTDTQDRDYGPDGSTDGATGTVEAPTATTDPRQDTDRVTTGNFSIGDFVWFDVDGDGAQDTDEAGIANVTVSLLYAGQDGIFGNTDDVTLGTDDTDANGAYEFTGLAPGNYRVSVDNSDLPDGTASVQTFDRDGLGTANRADVTITTASITDADFGYRGTGSIGDLVWLDLDGNASQNGTEPGIGGVTIDLYWDLDGSGTINAGDKKIQTLTTDVNGAYDFTNLFGDDYLVDVTDTGNVLADTTLTGATGVTDPEPVTITAGQDYNDADFGYRGSASISDFVWFDLDNDGVQDTGEPGIPSVDISLWQDLNNNGTLETGTDRKIATDTTDASGNYLFDNLIAGNYIVEVDTASPSLTAATNTFDKDDNVANANNNSQASVQLGSNEDDQAVDFGYQGGPISISGRSYHDRDQNNDFDGVDTGMGGVTIELIVDLNNNGVVDGVEAPFRTTTTSADGSYSFINLTAGNYLVRETQPTGFGNSENGTNLIDVTLVATNVTNQDFGNTTASITGTVYEDKNDNGTQDAGEDGISGVSVELEWSGGDGIFGTADDRDVTVTTNGSGDYIFDHNNTENFYTGFGNTTRGLLSTGEYRIIETQPAAFNDGKDKLGSEGGTLGNDRVTALTLTAGVAATGYDFGEIPPIDPDDPRTFFRYDASSPTFLPFEEEPEDDEWYNPEDPMPFREPILPLMPIYSGHAERGTTLVIKLYNSLGVEIGQQTVVADAGGNWMATFPNSIIFDMPHAATIQQTAPTYSSDSGNGFNLRTYFSPAINKGHFFIEAMTVEQILKKRTSTVVDSERNANESPLAMSWEKNYYEFLGSQSTPSGF